MAFRKLVVIFALLLAMAVADEPIKTNYDVVERRKAFRAKVAATRAMVDAQAQRVAELKKMHGGKINGDQVEDAHEAIAAADVKMGEAHQTTAAAKAQQR
eukprot:gnl/TRDRNA2_/TRDRNA2_179637_c0_seq1.p1 gnl/TRDRNA2_/TRDRNA2_179637_c0~~gnl/TRDRNA2_/TRDRNA2_179637_c0_seq1.p1  ORF type:complete len:100 (+),score=27.22 gnl/TRDRNA2_/TRDRNA2_179637_c0_seq1:61-360(+)